MNLMMSNSHLVESNKFLMDIRYELKNILILRSL